MCHPPCVCWHPGEITGLPSAKSWARAGLELQWWCCGICSYFCIEDLLFQWCHFICNYNYFPENQGPRLLFYEVIKLISHNKSCLCLVCSGQILCISFSLSWILLAAIPRAQAGLLQPWPERRWDKYCIQGKSLLQPTDYSQSCALAEAIRFASWSQ